MTNVTKRGGFGASRPDERTRELRLSAADWKRLIPACFQRALSRRRYNSLCKPLVLPIGHAGRAQLLRRSDIVLLGEVVQKLS
jgi:hypothetical protein